jgi:hypothetical protein
MAIACHSRWRGCSLLAQTAPESGHARGRPALESGLIEATDGQIDGAWLYGLMEEEIGIVQKAGKCRAI